MNDCQTSEITDEKKPYQINRSQLPLHCPTQEMSLWNSHPRVFLPIEQKGTATCPYCGTQFTLEK